MRILLIWRDFFQIPPNLAEFENCLLATLHIFINRRKYLKEIQQQEFWDKRK